MSYEFCPRCEANLTLQKGYSNIVPYWKCHGCGEMLINPDIPGDSSVVWICDVCEAMLNVQKGFSDNNGLWRCSECGFENVISEDEIYITDDEYQESIKNPYLGLDDDKVLSLAKYDEEGILADRNNVILARNMEDGQLYVKKLLTEYDIDIYNYLMEHSIASMPKIIELYESKNALIIIEEYIEGKTLEEILEEGVLPVSQAVDIAKHICAIVSELHGLDTPIIHRDIKPSNIIISDDANIYLLDVNVAKRQGDDNEETRLLGTVYYAAPEQFGYGLERITCKADIYAIGVLLNRMVTGMYPKKEQATGEIWEIIRRCIALEPSDRYSDAELLEELERIMIEK